MGWLTFALFLGLTLFACWQILPAIKRIQRVRVPAAPALSRPRAQVILSLKGLDPFLDRCLERLASQDYPNYQVTVVVDSHEDPAWQQARAAQSRFGATLIDLKVRTYRSTTCTRKLCNLLTVFAQLPPEVEIVALCDGDAVVHESWLSELVAGLDDPQMAAVGANRWYSPPTSDIASLSRHYWNAIAIPNTHQHAILWAGSLALRRSIVDEPEFRAAFGRGFSDDTLIARYLDNTGRKSQLLGGTYVVNSETTSLAGFWNFLVRQMLCVRIHHPKWQPIFVHAIAVAVATPLAWSVALLGHRGDAALALSGLALYGAALLGLIHAYDGKLRRTFAERPALQVPVDLRRAALILPAIALTSLIYPAATIVAAFARRHLWRGVEYHLRDGQVVQAIDLSVSPIVQMPAPSTVTQVEPSQLAA